MDQYLELLQLYKHDMYQFCRLSFICVIQNLFVLYIILLLFQINPVASLLFGVYAQVFINIYLGTKLHDLWLKRGKVEIEYQ
jgi:hypothetical protein